ncbi:hypothetical protein [Pseudomonas sp.]|uniref:hypothetical protein n=1 Tax=Pseudomonas sp. TaxID=306 RepID=UPI00261722CD|nr:hypothetical protein [Pseudomonas sp.]
MEKNFTDLIVEINEITQGNDLLRSLMLNNFYESLPGNIRNNFKIVLNKFYFLLKNKRDWICGHNGCENESCYSHDISEGIFLKTISDSDSMVITLKRDMKNSPISFIEQSIHIRNATNFPGYCSFHDELLFRDIENKPAVLDELFVNKQCLRSARRRKFEIEFQMKSGSEFIASVPGDLIEIEEIKSAINYIKKKIEALEESLDRINKIYDKIKSGIESSRFEIQVVEFKSKKSGYYFSTCLDLSSEKDDFPYILFIFKFDFGLEPRAFACILKDNKSIDLKRDIESNLSNLFMHAFYEEKEKLVFSRKFAEKLSGIGKGILYRDADLYILTSIEKAILQSEFF